MRIGELQEPEKHGGSQRDWGKWMAVGWLSRGPSRGLLWPFFRPRAHRCKGGAPPGSRPDHAFPLP
eukprot:765844-Alexandrium_andersonii.AAC.1